MGREDFLNFNVLLDSIIPKFLGVNPISMFKEPSQVLPVNYFRKKYRSDMFDCVLNTLLDPVFLSHPIQYFNPFIFLNC